MTDSEKKLDALIDALGFDVEKINVNPRRHDRYPSNPVYDYKLTKRKEHPLKALGDCIPLEIQSEAWGSIVKYITSHSNDIEYGVNDFGGLLPAWEFMNRNYK